MKERTYRCGKCGQSGHNRTGCGKTFSVPEVPPNMPLLPYRTDDTGGNTSRSVAGESSVRAVGSAAGADAGGESRGFSVDDVTVWWELAGGGAVQSRGGKSRAGKLAQFIDRVLQAGVAPVTVRKFLSRFSVDDREDAVNCADCTERVLVLMSEDSSAAVREAVAMYDSPFVPDSVLVKLARDPDFGVRVAVLGDEGERRSPIVVNAVYDGLGDEVLAEQGGGYRCSFADFRAAVLGHENLGAEKLWEALPSSDERTVFEALQNPKVTGKHIVRVRRGWGGCGEGSGEGEDYGDDERVVVTVMGNPETPTRILAEHSRVMLDGAVRGGDWDYAGLTYLASNLRCPQNVLDNVARTLAEGRESCDEVRRLWFGNVVRWVVENPNVGCSTLEMFRDDTWPDEHEGVWGEVRRVGAVRAEKNPPNSWLFVRSVWVDRRVR